MAGRQNRRSRTRKRRAAAPRPPADGATAVASTGGESAPASGSRSAKAQARHQAAGGATQRQWHEAVSDARGRGPARERGPVKPQRPPPPWHPLPLSEILILLGTLGFVIGMRRGANSGGRVPLLLGVAVVSLGTMEVCLREHRSGFRGHSILLALLPVVLFHTLAVVIITAFTHVSQTVNLGLVVVDLALFVLLFRLLRVHYGEARYRTLTGARRARP